MKVSILLSLFQTIIVGCSAKQNGLYSLTLNFVKEGKRLKRNIIHEAKNVSMPANCAKTCYVS